MARYFIEVSYLGTAYSGFQVQANPKTIQQAITTCFTTFYRQNFVLTGSSRTDAGVHALQNFFHFDTDIEILPKHVYSLNSLLPRDVSINNILPVAENAHCRFHATHRTYQYKLSRRKDPFLYGRSYYYPFTIDKPLLQSLAGMVIKHNRFSAFSKAKTQVKNFNCSVFLSEWNFEEHVWTYTVQANRFLRGMVRGLVATMLSLARAGKDPAEFHKILSSEEMAAANFSAPAEGLFLTEVGFNSRIFTHSDL